MNFLRLEYWPALLLAFLVFAVVVVLLEKRFFRVIKTYWFAGRSFFSRFSTALFLTGMGLLLMSLLDARGPEEKIKAEVPAERTIILIDTSASMLAEDVKPSRLQKAVLVAKHYARKAAGQQISIVAFAEIQKKIVPFTDDLDLIDSRLDSLKNLRNQYGSSALTVALQESIQYFREAQGEARGNVLVLTDGEETAEGLDLKFPKDIHVAFVGIGTTRGGRIPLDDGRGFRFGFKKNRGKDVITRLNEGFFKRAVADLPSAKYWLANSYSLPTDEILDFFRSEKVKGMGEQDMVVRPVMMEWLVVPALILIVLSQLLKAVRIFTLGLLLLIAPLGAQEEGPQLSPEMVERMARLQEGKLSQLERLKLADDLREAGMKNEALTLYEENLDPKNPDPSLPPEAYLNYGTALLEKGETQAGLTVYKDLLEKTPDSGKKNELKDLVDKNVVTHFRQQEEKKKQEKEEKDKQKKEGGEQQGQKDQNGQSGQAGEQKKEQNQSGKDKKDPSKDKGEDEKKENDPEKGDENKDEGDEDGQDKEDGDEGEEKRPAIPKKVPAKLKQLMSDDRQLQMKMIEQGTRDLNRRRSRESKDW